MLPPVKPWQPQQHCINHQPPNPRADMPVADWAPCRFACRSSGLLGLTIATGERTDSLSTPSDARATIVAGRSPPLLPSPILQHIGGTVAVYASLHNPSSIYCVSSIEPTIHTFLHTKTLSAFLSIIPFTQASLTPDTSATTKRVSLPSDLQASLLCSTHARPRESQGELTNL